MFRRSDVFSRRADHFSSHEKTIYFAGFIGVEEANWFIVSFKKGFCLYLQLREEWNRDVRQRFRNEMSAGFIKNRKRTFMWYWPYSEDLFTICICNTAMIMNWMLERDGWQLIPIDGRINPWTTPNEYCSYFRKVRGLRNQTSSLS